MGTERPGGRAEGQTMSRRQSRQKANAKAGQEYVLEREPETSGGLPAAGGE